MSDPLAGLAELLGLDADETLAIFELLPLDALGGTHAHRPEITILAAIAREAAGALGSESLRRWVRAAASGRRPIELLLAGAFAAFEDALASRVADALPSSAG